MVDDKKEIFINSQSDNPTIEQWQAIGSPKVWLLTKTIYLNRLTHRKVIKIWQDLAYGGIRMEVNGRVETGDDLVQMGEFIVMGEAWGYAEPMVFRRVRG